MKAKRINNMKIKYNKIYEKYQIVSPTNIVLEEFETIEKAVKWAKEQKDFIKNYKKRGDQNEYE